MSSIFSILFEDVNSSQTTRVSKEVDSPILTSRLANLDNHRKTQKKNKNNRDEISARKRKQIEKTKPEKPPMEENLPRWNDHNTRLSEDTIRQNAYEAEGVQGLFKFSVPF